MTIETSTDAVRKPILVVGAGPTGTVLAIELARRGVPVRIIEKRLGRVMESRANGVHSRTVEIFSDLGIAEELIDSGNRVHALSFRNPRRRLFQIDFRHLDAPYPFMLVVPQHQTQRLLDSTLEALGVAIEWGVELTGLHDRGPFVEVHTRDATGVARQFEAPYVIGCDGVRSAVRELVGIPFEGADYGQDWLGSDIDIHWDLPEDEAHVFVSERGTLPCFPFGRGHWRMFAPQVPNRSATRAAPDLAEMQALAAARGPAGIRVDNPTWLGVFRASRASASRYRSGRVFLAGDALHVHSPAAGQGMNTGIGDAYNLGWKLARVVQGGAGDGLLDTYQLERAPAAAGVLQLTHFLVRVFGEHTRRAKLLRSGVLPLASRFSTAQRRAGARLGQLSLSYRHGPLAAASEPARGRATVGVIRPGDRVPQVDGLVRAGVATSLFDLMRGPAPTVLLFPRDSDDAARVEGLLAGLPREADEARVFVVADGRAGSRPAHLVVDEGRRLSRLFGWPGFCVIRPDGYLGSAGSLGTLGARPSAVFPQPWTCPRAGARSVPA